MSDQVPEVCLITGGSSGIGLATAQRFAMAGSAVVICARNADRLAVAEQAIAGSARHDRVLAVAADLRDPNACRNVVQRTVARFGRLDLLVNAAAMAPLSPLAEMADVTFQELTALNIGGVYHTVRAAWPVMKEQGGGIIVNISSLSAVDPFLGLGLYGATKAWLETLTLALSREGRVDGIRVYAVRPGTVDTPMLHRLFPDFPAEQSLSADEVAEVISLLCHPAMRNSSGQVIEVSRQPG